MSGGDGDGDGDGVVTYQVAGDRDSVCAICGRGREFSRTLLRAMVWLRCGHTEEMLTCVAEAVPFAGSRARCAACGGEERVVNGVGLVDLDDEEKHDEKKHDES